MSNNTPKPQEAEESATNENTQDAQTNAVDDLLAGPFLTGVEIDVDQWRAQTIEELQGWLDNIKNRTTSMGDPLVDFPQDWDPEKILSQKQQFDMISEGLARELKGTEAREAQAELQSIRAQADKIRQLDKVLNQLDNDDEDDFLADLPPEDEALLNTDIVIPNIDTSGPNPFELDEATAARLKEIDEKLGIDEQAEAEAAAKAPKRTMDEINNDLLKLYQSQSTSQENPESKAEANPQPIETDTSLSKIPSPKKEQPKAVPSLRPKAPKMSKR